MMTYSRPKLPVWGRAGTEVRSPSYLLLLFPFSTSLLDISRAWVTKAQTNSSGPKRPWKALQLCAQTSAPYADRVNRRGKGDEAPGHLIVFDEAIWPSDRICWTRNVWSPSVSQPWGSWAGSGSGLAVHGMKVYSTRIMHPLYSLPTPCFRWPLQKM